MIKYINEIERWQYICLLFQSRMARTNSRAIGRRQNAIHIAAPGFRIRSSIHPERNSRLDRHRVQRTRRIRPLLAPNRRNVQVRVRQENRPRGCFTIESGVQHQWSNFLSLSELTNKFTFLLKNVYFFCIYNFTISVLKFFSTCNI